jgi:signal transduction histidine kinase
VIDELETRATNSGVKLVADVPAVEVVLDPDLLHRVLANLVENAIRHAPEDTDIKIIVTCGEGATDIRVGDGGPGVPQELRERIFERFESGGAGATRSNRGLGLAFCKIAVEAHGGRIWVEDGSPGAVFVMRFPDAAQ